MLDVALAGVITAATPSGGPQHSWQFIGAGNDAALFVDDSSVATEGTAKTIWVIGIPDPTGQIEKEAPGTYVMSLHRVDCGKQTDAITRMMVYTDGGDVAADRANPYPAAQVAPYSMGELIYRYVCKGEITTDKVAKLHSLADVKSFGRGWLELYDKLDAMSRTGK